MDTNCIFCKIISKEIPSSIVYEDEDFLGFLDVHPVAKGHALLIPKAHYPWIHEVPDEIIASIFIKAKNIIIEMRNNLKCDFVEVKVVGKDVPHFHIHLIPRMLSESTSAL